MAGPILSEVEIDDFVITRVVTFANKIQRVMLRDVLGQHDMPLLEWRFLYSIACFGDCHLAHIIDQTPMDPAHGSRAVAALDARGLIIRTHDIRDGRRKVLSMTPTHRVKFGAIWPQGQRLINRVTDQMAPEDFIHFKHTLDQANPLANPILEESLAARRASDAA
ncbi:MAG: MarR family winged helix-turn-helix transcriptional regulator [Pseudomonadota bacterium]